MVPTAHAHDEAPPELRPAPVALLLIDVISPMDFDGAAELLPAALSAAAPIARLKRRATACGVPTIYVNDNFDAWHLGFHELVERVRRAEVPGTPLVERLAPEPSVDYYVLKPLHSGFFRTPLEVLLQRLETTTLVLCGFASDICVLFTANDAYMRGFDVVVPADCVAAERAEDGRHAIRQMERLLKADVTPSDALDLEGVLRRAASRTRPPGGTSRTG